MKNTLSDKEFIQCAHIEGHDLLSCDGEDWVHFLWRDIVFDKIYEKYFKIEENDIIIDIGANIGIFAASCSQKNIDHCYCFEPMPQNFQYLKKNISQLDDFQKFTLVQQAISPHKEIYVGEHQDKTTPYPEKEKTNNCITLDTVKLVDFTQENKIEKVDFIKMDIEGGEWDVFESEDLDWILKNTRKFVAEIHLEQPNSMLHKGCDHRQRFNIDFIRRFKENGFSTRITSVDGFDIEDRILNNSLMSDLSPHSKDIGKKAHDFYNQFYFYAWKEIKIGIQMLAYNCKEAFPRLIEPWAKLKDEFNFKFWVNSRQFRIYEEMGSEDVNAETLEMLRTDYSQLIDCLSVPEKTLSDDETRSLSLEYFKKEEVDLIWILDADEFYTEEEIRNAIKYVQENPQYDWYCIRFKS